MTLQAPLRRELPFLVIEIALLVVLLHANAPEVWFWFAVLLVLLLWRGWAWIWRRRERQGDAEISAPTEAGNTSGSDTGAAG
jgi:Ca2+/Na+ antiporter